MAGNLYSWEKTSWTKYHVYCTMTDWFRWDPSHQSRYLIAKARLEDEAPGTFLSLFMWGSIFAHLFNHSQQKKRSFSTWGIQKFCKQICLSWCRFKISYWFMQSIFFFKFLPCVYQCTHSLYANIFSVYMREHSIFRENPALHKLFLKKWAKSSHALGKLNLFFFPFKISHRMIKFYA